MKQLAEAEHRNRLITRGLARSMIAGAVVVAGYYLLPLDVLKDAPIALSLVIGLLLLVANVAFQLYRIQLAKYPGIRAMEGLATTIPLFIVLFAASYYVMRGADASSFNADLTRTDALYLTVTVFSTVGFGDIAPVSETARLVVTVQMLLDLVVLGLGVRLFLGAVKMSQQRSED